MENLVLFLLLAALSTGWPLLYAQQLPTEPPVAADGLSVVSRRTAVTATTGDPKLVLSCTLIGLATEVNTFCATNQSLLWRVNSTRLEQTPYQSDFLVEGNCTHTDLTFLRVFPQLEGSYSCELSNNQTVMARTRVTIQPGCNPDIFRKNVAVGKSVTTPCGSIHPAFNGLGNIQWTCVDHLTWDGDLSECTMMLSYNKSILLFLYRVVIPPGSEITPLVQQPAPLEQDFLNSVLPMVLGDSVEASVRIADVRTAEAWMTELLVLFAVEPQGPVHHGDVVQAAQGPVMLAGGNASPIYAGNPMLVPSDTCTCTRLWSEFSDALSEMVPVTVSFCRAPGYVRSPCRCGEGCQCSGVFYDIGTETINCTLDTDGDGIPNVIDPCEGCCLGEVNSGYTWMDSPIQLNSHVSCASIHPFFNAKSYADRRCTANAAGIWAAVDVSACAFRSKVDMTIVVLEAEVDLGYVQETGQNISEAVMDEIMVQFSNYSLLDVDIRVSGGTHVVAVLEFPIDVSKDVVLVYWQSPRKREIGMDLSQREKRGSMLSLFSDTPLVYGHTPAYTCPCSPTPSSLSGRLIQTCIGPPGRLCKCAGLDCRCVDPYARTLSSTNSTVFCGVDSDGDGIADVDDRCPEVYDPENACSDGVRIAFEDDDITCVSEADPVWGIVWSQTAAGSTDTQRCPGGVTYAAGLATRMCDVDGQWERADVKACESYEFATVRSTSVEVEESLYTLPAFSERSGMFRVDASSGSINVLMDSTYLLMSGTEPGTQPLLPMDIDATLVFLEVVSLFSEITTLFADADFDENMMFSIIDNILANNNQDQWELLNEYAGERSANLLLELVERISQTYSFNLDTNLDASSEMDDNGVDNMYLTWDGLHIFVSAELISPTTRPMGVPRRRSIRGAPPQSFDRPDMVPKIAIPSELIEERAQAREDNRVSVVTVLISTLADFLPRRSEEDIDANATIASVIIVSQVFQLGGQSTSLQTQPVQIRFPITNVVRAGANTTCVFWNFSSPTTSSGRMGGWSRSGLDMDDIASGSSDVTCFSSHLTSFAILVDASGGTGGIPPEEALAFDIVTYIGCAVSLVCLILTVIFYLLQGRDLYKKAVNFVHFNLAIALICGLVIFLCGIQTATWSKIACGIVAALLHYFFLAAFSWMLCEGVSLYLLLVKVFGANKKKWLLMYTLLGWCTPLPIVAVSVGIRYDFYRIPQSYNTSSTLYHQARACWLPTEHGIIAAFVVPMLVMILINCVFGALALWSLFKFKRDQMKRSMDGMKERKIAVTLMKAMVILLPLLGLTWVIGLLAVNPYTTVFAWIFLFLNAFQGAFIFFFHVVRHDKVWPKLVKGFSRCRKTKTIEVSSSKRSNTASTSAELNRTNTAISVLDYSRKESINSVVIAHDGNIEKAIPATVIEEEEQKKDISEF